MLAWKSADLNVNGNFQAKSNYWASKYDTNGRICGLEHQLTLKNEGRMAASYLAADVCKPNLNGVFQAKSNYLASKYDVNGRICRLERQLTLKNEGRTAASYLAADVCRWGRNIVGCKQKEKTLVGVGGPEYIGGKKKPGWQTKPNGE